MLLSSACAREGDYVVGFEAIDDSLIFIAFGESDGESGVGEICGDVGELTVCCPDVVAGQEEIVGEDCGVHAVEYFVVVEADIVQAHVLGLGAESFAIFFVEGVSVEVVVDGVVVYHLRNGEIVEEAWRAGAPEIFGEALHEQCLSHSGGPLEHDVLVEFITSVGEDVFGEPAFVEIQEKESDDGAVVVVDDEGTVLRGEDYAVGDIKKKPGMHLVYCGVGHVGKCLGGFSAIVFGTTKDVSDFECFIDGVGGVSPLEGVEEGFVPVEIAGRLLAEFG